MDAIAVVPRDPALGDVVEGRGVEVVELLPAATHGCHEVGRLEDGEMLAYRLPGHVESRAELAQRLAVPLVEAVQQQPPARVGQCPEGVVHAVVLIGSHLAAYNMQPVSCMSRPTVALY
jgi:hypothetical protein